MSIHPAFNECNPSLPASALEMPDHMREWQRATNDPGYRASIMPDVAGNFAEAQRRVGRLARAAGLSASVVAVLLCHRAMWVRHADGELEGVRGGYVLPRSTLAERAGRYRKSKKPYHADVVKQAVARLRGLGIIRSHKEAFQEGDKVVWTFNAAALDDVTGEAPLIEHQRDQSNVVSLRKERPPKEIRDAEAILKLLLSQGQPVIIHRARKYLGFGIHRWRAAVRSCPHIGMYYRGQDKGVALVRWSEEQLQGWKPWIVEFGVKRVDKKHPSVNADAKTTPHTGGFLVDAPSKPGVIGLIAPSEPGVIALTSSLQTEEVYGALPDEAAPVCGGSQEERGEGIEPVSSPASQDDGVSALEPSPSDRGRESDIRAPSGLGFAPSPSRAPRLSSEETGSTDVAQGFQPPALEPSDVDAGAGTSVSTESTTQSQPTALDPSASTPGTDPDGQETAEDILLGAFVRTPPQAKRTGRSRVATIIQEGGETRWRTTGKRPRRPGTP